MVLAIYYEEVEETSQSSKRFRVHSVRTKSGRTRKSAGKPFKKSMTGRKRKKR